MYPVKFSKFQDDNMANILVVDDEPLQCQTIKVILKSAGHQVFIAGDGYKGIELFKSNDIHLVISDIIMPEMEGIEFIRSILKIEPNSIIIVISGNSIGRDFLEVAVKLGAKEKLVKPIDKEKLLHVINRLLATNHS